MCAEDYENFTHYKARLASIAQQAGVNSGSGTNMFYSFDHGNAHFVLWDSEAWWAQSADSQQAMINWLQADLAKANANRAAVPWVISLAHKAWYMDDTLNTPTGAGASVWQILTAAGVDLFICGHIHEYQRSLPFYPNANNGTGVVDNTCATNVGNATNPSAVYTDPKYMTMVITAAPGDQEVNAANPADRARVKALAAKAGVSEAAMWSTLKKSSGASTLHGARNKWDAPDAGVQASSSNYGFSKLQILNATHLHWTFSTSVPHVNSTNPTFTDELWLVVNEHGPRSNLPPM